MDKLGIVILNYNGINYTKECVRSFLSIEIKIDFEIIIVDNNSVIKEKEQLIKFGKEYNCNVLLNDINLGYAAGNNVGIKYAIKNGCNYICILNNDTIIEEDFFSKCVSFIQSNTDVAFVGPIILNDTDDFVQSTGGNVSLLLGKNSIINMGEKRSTIKKNIECDYVGGACIIVDSDYIISNGDIPEAYFLFFEESEWCYKAKKKGYRNVILSDCTIRHKGSVSIKKTEGLSEYMYERNLALFVKRNSSNKIELIIFVLIHSLVILERIFRYGVRYCRQFTYMIDGLCSRVSDRFPFIYVNEDGE